MVRVSVGRTYFVLFPVNVYSVVVKAGDFYKRFDNVRSSVSVDIPWNKELHKVEVYVYPTSDEDMTVRFQVWYRLNPTVYYAWYTEEKPFASLGLWITVTGYIMLISTVIVAIVYTLTTNLLIYSNNHIKNSLKPKSVVPRRAAIIITIIITIKVEIAISFLLDQLTFLISPSAAIIKFATDCLFAIQNTTMLKATNKPTGTMVSTHNPRSAACNFL